MSSAVSLQELHDFHSIDRQVYSRLVINLGLDFNIAKQVMSFWYWFERKGYRRFIDLMLQLTDPYLYGFAMEAKFCLDCLVIDQSLALYFDFPLMRPLVCKDFFIIELCQDREISLKLIEGFYNYLSDKVFDDIIPENQSPNGFTGFPIQVPTVSPNGFEFPGLMTNVVQAQCSSSHVAQPQPVAQGVQAQETVADGAQALSLVNEAKVQTSAANEAKGPYLMANGVQAPALVPNSMSDGPCLMANGVQDPALMPNSVANGDQVSHIARNWQATHNLLSVSEHDRTLFITFSKGRSAISKMELRDLITRKFGNCVESIHMRVEPPPLYALVVVISASALANILRDKDLVKLSCNGKDVWLRRFLPKQDDNQLQQQGFFGVPLNREWNIMMSLVF